MKAIRNGVENHGSVMRVKPGKVARYRELHTVNTAGIAAESVAQRWWAECAPGLELLPDHAPGEVWSGMREVFHLD